MRIVLIALHFTEYSFKLANALANDHDVLMISESHAFKGELGSLNPETVHPRLKLHFVEHRRNVAAIFSNTASIKSAVKAFKPDVVHLQEAIWDYLLLALPYLKGFPLILTIHDPEPHSGESRLPGLQKRYHFYRWLLRRNCDAAIAHGDFLTAEVERLYPHLRGKVFSIPHGPLGEIDDKPQFDWEPGALLFFGRIQAYKGLVYFIEAVEGLAAKGLPVKGIIAGRGGELDKYRDRIAASGLFELQEGFIPREEIPALFHRAQIVVLPYTDGTQSGVAALAMGFGRPVVASNVGSIPELVMHGKNGLLASPKNAKELIENLEKILLDQLLCRQMAEAGWGFCQTDLSWKNIGNLSLKAYKTTVLKRMKG